MRNEKFEMREKKYIIPFGFIFVFTILLTVCNNNLVSPENQPLVENGYGRINITLVGEKPVQQQSRTVLPSTVFNKYVYTFTKAGEETGIERIPDNEGFFILEVGTYTVVVQAYVGNEESYILVANGISSAFNVESDNNDPVEVILTAVDAGEAEGKFSYTITIPTGAEADIILQKWQDMSNITLTPSNLIEGNGITEIVELKAGYYLLTVLVRKNGLYAGVNEAVHIYPSILTVYSKDFTDNDLTSEKIPGASIGTPTLNSRTHNSITINPVFSPTIQSVEYGINTSDTEPSEWYPTLIFSGLESGTTYYIFARTVEYGNYEAGAASDSLLAATLSTVSIEYYWVDEHDSLVTTSGGSVGVAPGEILTITAQSEGFNVRQWHLNGVNTGQSGNTYNFSKTAAGKYTIGLFVEKDGKIYNTNITITVFVITITTQPTSRTVTAGSISGSLSVAANVTPGATLSYQWYNNTSNSNINGAAISGANNSSYTIPTNLTGGTYYYFCEVSTALGVSVRSNVATVTVTMPVITITTHPTSRTVTTGSISGYLSVTATVAPSTSLSYQWYSNISNSNTSGTAINGATNASYTIPTTLTGGTYYYFCEVRTTSGVSSTRSNVATVNVASVLTASTWSNGNIPLSNGEEWFRFTATASTQYIHVIFGTLTNLYVHVYDTNFNTVSTETNLRNTTRSTTRALTNGQVYYIRVRPYDSTGNGTYDIAFNTSSTIPTVTTTNLTANTWSNGNITSPNGAQWFRFTAPASTFISIRAGTSSNPGTLANARLYVYDSNFNLVSLTTPINLSNTGRSYFDPDLTSGQIYYIRVQPNDSSSSGTFQIGFNSSNSMP